MKPKGRLDKSLKLLVKSSFIVLIGIIISKILAYIYRILIARMHGVQPGGGVEIYGMFNLAVVIVNLFIAISSLGLVAGILRYISVYRGKKETDKIRYIVRFTMITSIISGIIATLTMFFSSEYISLNIFHNSGLIPYLKWFSITIPLSIFAGIFILIIQAYEKIEWYSFIRNILDNVVKVSALVMLIFLGLQSNAVIFSYVLGVMSMILFSYFYCRYRLSEVFEKSSLNDAAKKSIKKELFAYSWPLMFLGVVMFLFTWIDSFAIGYFIDVKSVGIYNAATPIVALLFVAPGLFIQLFFPLIIKEYSRKNNDLIKEMSKQVGKWIFLLNLPFFLLIILFPGTLINLLFGPEYIAAENPLRFLAIGSFFYSILIVSENLISMVGKSKIILFNVSITSSVNLVLNIIFIKIWGITGAAIATMIAYILWSILTLIQAKKYTSIIPFKRKMFLIVAIAIIPTAVIFITKIFIPINFISLVFQGILFLLIYFLLVITTGCLDKNDWMIINAIKGKILFKKS